MRARRDKSRRLIPSAVTAAFALAATGGLLALAAGGPRPELAEPGRDPVTVAYLRAFVAEHPGDTAMRLRLVREQLALGMLADAEAAVSPLLAGEDDEAITLALEIALSAWRAARPGTPERAGAEARTIARLELISKRAATADRLARVAASAREVGHPALAARAEERAAELDRAHCARWLAGASRDFLAAADPERAAAAGVRAFACAGDGPTARALAREALDLLVAANRAGDALALADRLVARFPHDRELLARAEQLARAGDDPARARRYARLLVERGAADVALLERLFDLDLAAGDLPAALRTAERLAGQTTGDPQLEHLVARVASWAGRPHVALGHWMWLARRGDTIAFANALRLAHELEHDAAVAELLAGKARGRKLGAAELSALVAAFERLGAPDRAAALLEETARRSTDDAAWERLVGFHERRRDLASAIRARTEMIQRRGASLSRSLPLARLLWASGRAGAALAELGRWIAIADHRETPYWELVAELAWQQESDELAARAYRALRDGGAIDAVGIERSIILDHEAGRHAQAIRHGREGWERLGEPRLLLVAMNEAVHAGAWDELARLRTSAERDEQRFAGSLAYWLLSAEVDRRAGRVADAAKHYRRALAVDAGSAEARAGLLWMLIDRGGHDELSRRLADWSADAKDDARLWRVYAAGLERLGRMPEALAFYRREAEAGDDRDARERYLAAVRRATVADAPAAATARATVVTADAGVTTLGPLVSRRVGATVTSDLRADLQLAARASFASVTGGVREGDAVDLLAGATVTALGGRTEIFGGAGLSGDGAVLRGTVAHARQLTRRAQARMEAALNDVAPESATLSVEATRTRAGGAFAIGAERLYGRVTVEWKAWSTRSGTWLGRGGAAALELGLRARLRDPELVVRLQGGYQRNQLAMSTDASLLPAELATAGIGVGAARWRLGPATLLADAWLGWVTPPLRRAYRLQTGLAVRAFGRAELSVTGHVANDHWVLGRGELGMTASLAYRFASPRP